MNKELFVSSTPHETKVGLVEDDLLAEIYLERENEYTLAGSIYKGRVTRVLPGMQSAFVDIGLERDAFLYVSDFMELEEHDEDLTDVVPANRGVQDMRQQSPQEESASSDAPYPSSGEEDVSFASGTASDFVEGEEEQSNQLPVAASPDAPSEGFSQDRERGGYRGRRRRRGGRRDGRGDGRDRGPEPRVARPISENIPVPVVAPVVPPPPGTGTSAAVWASSRIPAHSASRRIDFEIPRSGASARDSGTPSAGNARRSLCRSSRGVDLFALL